MTKFDITIFFEILERNLSENVRQDDYSFLNFLHELRIWNEDEYWKLEFAMAKIASDPTYADVLPREIDCSIWKIFSFVMASFSWHFDSGDAFKINNLTDSEVREWRERVICVFEGFKCRKFPEQDLFDVKNPLL